jgi:hypothetical protein
MTSALTADQERRLAEEFEAVRPSQAPATLVSPMSKSDFCMKWAEAKNVLSFIASLPVVPSTVKDAVALIIKAGDTVTGVIC